MMLEVIKFLVGMIWCCVIAYAIGYGIGTNPRNKPKGKKLEEISDRELFMLQCEIFDEISKRGAKLIEPFEEFGGKEDGR